MAQEEWEKCGLNGFTCHPQLDMHITFHGLPFGVTLALVYLVSAVVVNKFLLERNDLLKRITAARTTIVTPMGTLPGRPVLPGSGTTPSPTTPLVSSAATPAAKQAFVIQSNDDEDDAVAGDLKDQALLTPAASRSRATSSSRGTNASFSAGSFASTSSQLDQSSVDVLRFFKDSICRFYLFTILWSLWTAIYLLTVSLNPFRCDMACPYDDRGQSLRGTLGLILLAFFAVVMMLLYMLMSMGDMAAPKSASYARNRRIIFLVATLVPFVSMMTLFIVGNNVTGDAAIYIDSCFSFGIAITAAVIGLQIPRAISNFASVQSVRQLRLTSMFLFVVTTARGVVFFPGVRKKADTALGEVCISTTFNLLVIYGAIVVLRTQRSSRSSSSSANSAS